MQQQMMARECTRGFPELAVPVIMLLHTRFSVVFASAVLAYFDSRTQNIELLRSRTHMMDSISLVTSERSLAITALFFLILVVIGGVLISPHNKLSGRGRAALPMKSLGRSPILQI